MVLTSNKQFVKFLFKSIFLFAILIFCHDGNAQDKARVVPKKPNISSTMVYDTGWRDMLCLDNPIQQTPYLDQMSNEGAVFDRFYYVSAVCAPTGSSVMNGSTPLGIDMKYCCSRYIGSCFDLFPGYLKKKGYAIGHFGKWYLGTMSKHPVDFPEQGRSSFKDFSRPGGDGFDLCFSTHNVVFTWDHMELPDQVGNWSFHRRSDDGWWGQYYSDEIGYMYSPDNSSLQGNDSRIIMNKVLPFIESRISGGYPFLTVIWFHAPYTPTVAGDEFPRMYAGCEERHRYGVISAMDAEIKRLRKFLAKLGVAKNTLIWFCSDNGAAKYNSNFGDYGGFGSNEPSRGWKIQLYKGEITLVLNVAS